MTWRQVAREIGGVNPGGLTRYRDGGRTTFPQITRIARWLDRPVATLTRMSNRGRPSPIRNVPLQSTNQLPDYPLTQLPDSLDRYPPMAISARTPDRIDALQIARLMAIAAAKQPAISDSCAIESGPPRTCCSR